MSIASRIESIEEHIGDIYDTLELGGSDLTNTDKNIVNINSELIGRYKDYLANGTDELWNNWDKTTNTGVNEATINNTIKGKMAITPKGDTEQATRSGKNLWNNSQVTNVSDYVVKNDTGLKLIKTANGRITPQYTINLIANTTYTISCNLTKTTTSTFLLCQWKTSGGTTLWSPNIVNGSTQFIPSDNIVGVIFYLQTTESDNSYVEVTNLQIEQGSTATDYEQYGASPSPEFPSEIKNVKGKNLALPTGGYGTTGVTRTLENQITTFNGTASSAYGVAIYLNNQTDLKLKANTPYAITVITTGKCTSSGYKNFYFKGQLVGAIPANGGTVTYIYTPTQDTIGTQLSLDLSANTVFENCSIKIQVEEGSTATPYLPYNTVEVKVQNKNILDLADLVQGYYIRGENPTITGSTDARFRSFSVFLKAGSYVINFNENANSVRAFTNYDYSTDVVLTNYYNSKTGLFTMEQDGTAYFSFRKNDGTDWNDSEDLVWINIGSTASNYIAHQEQIVNFPLSSGQVLHEGDYLADDGVHSVKATKILNGTENWNRSSNGAYYLDVSDWNYNKANKKICTSNYFQGMSNVSGTSSVTNNKISFYYGLQTSTISEFYCAYRDIETTEDFKTWLSTHNTVVEYELEEPTVTPYTTEQQTAWEQIKALMSYNEQTNITQDGDLPFILDVTALIELS